MQTILYSNQTQLAMCLVLKYFLLQQAKITTPKVSFQTAWTVLFVDWYKNQNQELQSEKVTTVTDHKGNQN